ncbi:TauD/TfdA dioxygenase family protein [Rhodopila sp.]|uniref:TauD/TfdA dioxygenase family protein n=1 Tax=Rhodopila sp. TaxID=2480087 RepID=UPI003D0D1833
MPTTTALHPLFAARVAGIDIGQPVSAADAAWLRDALDRWSVLVFAAPSITDDSQVAFSETFGTLETTRAGANGAGGKLIVLTNIGSNGQIAPPTDKQVLNNKANQIWHHDSSFKATPARASLLSAREIPQAGGDTEFASTRAAWQAMDPARRQRVQDRMAVHDFGWSRARVDPALMTAAERDAHPPVRRATVVAENPYGPALYLGAHARSIDGIPEAEGRVLIDGLNDFAGSGDFVYRHHWTAGDLVLWDNRAVMHRATPFASGAERRHMVRTTVECPPTVR